MGDYKDGIPFRSYLQYVLGLGCRVYFEKHPYTLNAEQASSRGCARIFSVGNLVQSGGLDIEAFAYWFLVGSEEI